MDEDKVKTRKQKAEQKAAESEHSLKKPKSEQDNGQKTGGKCSDSDKVVQEFEDLRKATEESLSVDQMRETLGANGQDTSGSDGVVTSKW